jgi:hypothetical protein
MVSIWSNERLLFLGGIPPVNEVCQSGMKGLIACRLYKWSVEPSQWRVMNEPSEMHIVLIDYRHAAHLVAGCSAVPSSRSLSICRGCIGWDREKRSKISYPVYKIETWPMILRTLWFSDLWQKFNLRVSWIVGVKGYISSQWCVESTKNLVSSPSRCFSMNHKYQRPLLASTIGFG